MICCRFFLSFCCSPVDHKQVSILPSLLLYKYLLSIADLVNRIVVVEDRSIKQSNLKMAKFVKNYLKIVAILLSVLVVLESVVEAEKGRDIIIYNGKVILKNGKKKGNIIIGTNEPHQGSYKYKKKYMNYGGFWR